MLVVVTGCPPFWCFPPDLPSNSHCRGQAASRLPTAGSTCPLAGTSCPLLPGLNFSLLLFFTVGGSEYSPLPTRGELLLLGSSPLGECRAGRVTVFQLGRALFISVMSVSGFARTAPVGRDRSPSSPCVCACTPGSDSVCSSGVGRLAAWPVARSVCRRASVPGLLRPGLTVKRLRLRGSNLFGENRHIVSLVVQVLDARNLERSSNS